MSSAEVAYYRAVEDHFARLRGTSFLFSPKDFALLRGWWSEGVPLAAVMAGIGEVAARRRERAEDPVSSLAYCRHAVARHAKRLAAAAVGGAAAPASAGADVPARLTAYASAVAAAARASADAPALAEALAALARAVATLPADAPVAALEATAAALEATALDAVVGALPEERRAALLAAVAATELAAGGEALPATARRSIRLQHVRAALALPRLELTGDAAED